VDVAQASRDATERALEQREAIRRQAEEALGTAEAQKQEAWQALDRMNADLDRALDRAVRAEYRLHSLQAKAGPSQLDRDLQVHTPIPRMIVCFGSELRHIQVSAGAGGGGAKGIEAKYLQGPMRLGTQSRRNLSHGTLVKSVTI